MTAPAPIERCYRCGFSIDDGVCVCTDTSSTPDWFDEVRPESVERIVRAAVSWCGDQTCSFALAELEDAVDRARSETSLLTLEEPTHGAS